MTNKAAERLHLRLLTAEHYSGANKCLFFSLGCPPHLPLYTGVNKHSAVFALADYTAQERQTKVT